MVLWVGFAITDPLAETVISEDCCFELWLKAKNPAKRKTTAIITRTKMRYCLLRYRFTSVLAIASLLYAIKLF